MITDYRITVLILICFITDFKDVSSFQSWRFKGHQTAKLRSNTRFSSPRFTVPTPDNILLTGDFEGIVPVKYDLTLKAPVVADKSKNGGLRFEGSVGISIRATDPVQTIMLHSKDIKLYTDLIQVTDKNSQKQLAIQDIYINRDHDLLIIETEKFLVPTREYLIKIPKFSGPIQQGYAVGIFSSFVFQAPTSHNSVIATQFQLDNARTVFPCIDVPYFKANLSLTVSHPPHYTALGNMQAVQETVLADGWIDTTFKTSPPLPTYTMALVIMPNMYRPLKARSIAGTEVNLHYDTQKMNKPFAEQLLMYAMYALNWYQSNIHVPLPLKKIDLVTLPQFVVQGMENFGLITLNKDYLTRVQEPEQFSLIAHELAHQWFSNLVTVKGWDHICFQEGLTDHYARKLVKQYFGANEQYQRYIADKYAVAILDETREVPPVSLIVSSTPQLSQVSGRCFGKNVFMIDALEELVGYPTFQTKINKFLDVNKNGHARLEDFAYQFRDVFVDNFRMSDFIEDWFMKPGYPSIFAYRNYASNSVLLRQDQVHPKASTYERTSQLWPLALIGEIETGEWDFGIQLLKHQEAIINVPIESNSWLLINQNFTGFYRVNYDLHNWNLIAQQLVRHPQQYSTITRGQLISDFCYFNRLGLLTNSDSVQKRMFEAVRLNPDLFRAYQPLMHDCKPKANNFRRRKRKRTLV